MMSGVRMCLLIPAFCGLALSTGCVGVNHHYLQQSQLRSQMLARQNQQMSGSLGSLTAENQALKQSLDVANQRLANIQGSNSQLEERVRNLLANARSGSSPLSDSATRRLEELRQKYPQFEFDPATGVSKFDSDLLFALGSDEVRPEGLQLLDDFAKIMNQPDAQHLRVLVVGHTDDKPISKASTKSRHPTNWHLSTNRANSVVLAMKKSGVQEKRMEAAGCSMFQPVTANTDDKSRAKNRRVEIFVLAPEAAVAGWDPATRIE